VHCLGATLSARIKDLPRFRERHGTQVLQRRELFAAGPIADLPPWGATVWSVEAAWPALEGNDTAAVAWNRLAADRFSEILNYDPVLAATSPVTMDELLDYSVQYATEQAIGLTWHYWSYGHGAAHGMPADAAMHYRLDQNRPLAADDVFAVGTNWEAALAQLCFDELRRRLGDGLFAASPDELAASAASPDSWRIGGDGLTVFFNVYEVASYAYGRLDVALPWSRLFPWPRNNAPPDFAGVFPAFLRR